MYFHFVANFQKVHRTPVTVTIPHICHLDHLYIGGEKIGHVEKFQISTHDRCGEIWNFSMWRVISDFSHNRCWEILPNLGEFHNSPHARCEEIWNLPCFGLWNLFGGNWRYFFRNLFCRDLRVFAWKKIEPKIV